MDLLNKLLTVNLIICFFASFILILLIPCGYDSDRLSKYLTRLILSTIASLVFLMF